MPEDRKALWYLAKVPLFEGLDTERLGRLAGHVTLLEIKRRRVIFLPGDAGDSLYFINKGRVKLSRVTRDGKELTLCYMGPGEVFGELCLTDGGPREDMAESMETVQLSQLPREVFEELLLDSALIGARMTRTLCQRRRELEHKVEDLVFKDVNAKLAELLLNLSEKYGKENSLGTLVNVKITHQEMANLIGSTRETVSLTLSQFKRDKLIASEGRKIVITNDKGMKALS